ncbi:MAG: tRNA (N6-threonylcarbamoyladenosine(37)-N6)-methyltransferase TrmO [bacterium]
MKTRKKTADRIIGRLRAVGSIRTDDDRQILTILPVYREGMLGMDAFSHLWVLYWFHENDDRSSRSVLKVHPRKDPANPLTGVFGTRSPMRPNLVGLDLCRVREVRTETGEVVVEGCQARDGTPLVDIKPYLPHSDRVTPVRLPAWARRRPRRQP